MVAAVSTTSSSKTTPRTTRRPLLPPEPDNALAPRRPKSREVTSRYLSSSSSTAKWSPSPLISRPAALMTPPTTKPSSPIKEKPVSSPISGRKGTPERRKATPTPARGVDQVENSRPVEQQRWPARWRITNSNSMTTSMDFADDRMRSTGSGATVVRALQSFMVDNRLSTESRLSSDSSNTSLEKPCHSESVSSGSTSEGSCNAFGGRQAQHGPCGVVVAARSWQETNKRHRRQSEPVSPVSKTAGLKGPAWPKLVAPKRLGTDSPVSSPKEIVNIRGQMSPVRSGAMRAASPGKFGSPKATLSPMRGMSPSRARNMVGAAVSSNLSNAYGTPSILSFAADIRRRKIGENQIVEVHLLRTLYNRLLQWRFINARVDLALSAQKVNTEKSLFGAHITTSKLRESVSSKKTEFQWLRQHLKLISILRGQMIYLEELELMDQEYSCSLLEAKEALQASTLHLPVVGSTRFMLQADVHNVKNAICSAVDVMLAMASSICSLLSKVVEVNSLVGELANVVAKEQTLLDQCKHLLSAIVAMQVKECTLRTHILQLKHVPSSLTTKL